MIEPTVSGWEGLTAFPVLRPQTFLPSRERESLTHHHHHHLSLSLCVCACVSCVPFACLGWHSSRERGPRGVCGDGEQPVQARGRQGERAGLQVRAFNLQHRTEAKVLGEDGVEHPEGAPKAGGSRSTQVIGEYLLTGPGAARASLIYNHKKTFCVSLILTHDDVRKRSFLYRRDCLWTAM